MKKHTIEAYVMNAVGRRIKRNLEFLVGKKLDTRKKPHVIYVALRVYILVS
jgi:hypothetical protein